MFLFQIFIIQHLYRNVNILILVYFYNNYEKKYKLINIIILKNKIQRHGDKIKYY